MSRRLRLFVPALVVVAALVATVVVLSPGGGIGVDPASPTKSPGGATGEPAGSGTAEVTTAPSPTPVPPLGGTELYGYLPYWQMTESMAAYLQDVPLTTLAMFSVSTRRNGAIDTRDPGYKQITSELGRRIIAEAHARGTRVEVVFTSFGGDRNGRFFGRLPRAGASPPPTGAPSVPSSAAASQAPPPEPWRRTVDELVSLARDLGVDGIDVDVEQMDELDRAAYGDFLTELGLKLRSSLADSTLTVATEAGLRGTGNAAAAARAGADRVFLMGYDYHWSGSQPGASSPVDRSDGQYTLRWSIDQYVAAGVPRDRIVLGLPLYGMSWLTTGPDRSAPVIGRGASWIPNRHTDVLLDPAFRPGRDPLEVAEFFIRPDGEDWRVTYYDSPATLRTKLAFARDQGLAGGGFWAVGYERGLPGYTELMRDFRNGRVAREEAPPAP
jgi:hypothetical protein